VIQYPYSEGSSPFGSLKLPCRPRRCNRAWPNSPTAHPDGDWQARLAEAIRVLESSVSQSPGSEAELARHVRLRMLYLIGSRRDDALRPIPKLAPAMQEFWSKQLYGLATLLDPQLISGDSDRRAQAKQHLSEAVVKLGGSCPLVLRNLTFVVDIRSYGANQPFESYEFEPGQNVLLYAEVENFKSHETARGFHTVSRSSYEIFDSSGRRVAEYEFEPDNDYCQNLRRDFFMVYDFCLPKRIYPGRHFLQLTIVDLNSQKIGQSVIEFSVKSPRE
jgi:hypothetical protein